LTLVMRRPWKLNTLTTAPTSAALKNRFQQEAKNLTKLPATTTFRRLQDTNELYQQHLGVDLEAAVGPQVWAALLQAAAIRHLLTHNAGVIDAKFLTRVTSWPQRQGERLQVRRDDTDRFLDVLEQFAATVLCPSYDSVVASRLRIRPTTQPTMDACSVRRRPG
jgi:hypothetical protein